LILFYEQTFALDVDQEDLTLDNFGTIDSMAAYLEKRGKHAQS
jgi:acyl carrier protein